MSKSEINTLIPALKEPARPGSSSCRSRRSSTEPSVMRTLHRSRGRVRRAAAAWARSRPTTGSAYPFHCTAIADGTRTIAVGRRASSSTWCPARSGAARRARSAQSAEHPTVAGGGPGAPWPGASASSGARPCRAALAVGAVARRALGQGEVARGVDERHVGERLGEVPEHALRDRVVLLGDQADVVGEPEQAVEELARLVEAPHAGTGCRRARTSRARNTPSPGGSPSTPSSES